LFLVVAQAGTIGSHFAISIRVTPSIALHLTQTDGICFTNKRNIRPSQLRLNVRKRGIRWDML